MFEVTEYRGFKVGDVVAFEYDKNVNDRNEEAVKLYDTQKPYKIDHISNKDIANLNDEKNGEYWFYCYQGDKPKENDNGMKVYEILFSNEIRLINKIKRRVLF